MCVLSIISNSYYSGSRGSPGMDKKKNGFTSRPLLSRRPLDDVLYSVDDDIMFPMMAAVDAHSTPR